VSALTRRGLLGAAAVAVLARSPARALAATASEPATLLALIRREDAAGAAYDIAADTTQNGTLERIARIDERHAHALRVGLESLTVPPEHRPPHAERDDPAAQRLAQAATKRDALAAAIALEHELLAAYIDAARPLTDDGLLQTVATIAGSHAQQLAVLRAAAGRPGLDEPGVSGR
jgi:Ferritin-like domain